ncbi:MAG: transglycosylase SLT domain-containing protein, partial [Xanthomonadales bacterium]|nr:transglycosylase SLT domain-containing protein [Xanthomonadales bacterium]
QRLMPGLEGYVLHPYLRYEDLRFRRAVVAPDEMAAFLDAHSDWAFANGLRVAWLRSLGERGRWQALLDHAPGVSDTEVRCHLARARLVTGDTAGLLEEVQDLWNVGRSQPDECDPAFTWLREQGGITPDLAWSRVRKAMTEGEPRLSLYLARYVPADEREWLERWQRLNASGYADLGSARHWSDVPRARMVAAESLVKLARRDAARAGRVLDQLLPHFDWEANERGRLQREVALWSAVALDDDALARMADVPGSHRDPQLLGWWVRAALAAGDWAQVQGAIEQMPAEEAADGRWRYWAARALAETGQAEAARAAFESLSEEASYHGFLAADRANLPYSICPEDPQVAPEAVDALAATPPFARALELRAVGLEDWASREWAGATRGLGVEELRAAAALARSEGWEDRAIFALGQSGDLRWYAWRFPDSHFADVSEQARKRKLEPSLVMGLMRSESALAPRARSPAGAMGLMQVMPGTATQLARKHGFRYSSREQLYDPAFNIQMGTAYLDDLGERFNDNPVLVASAYNAGPGAVNRWLDQRGGLPTDVWIETIPYSETRDYVPRVLAFTTLYDWRLDSPVRRISDRMPPFDSGNIGPQATAEVVCLATG